LISSQKHWYSNRFSPRKRDSFRQQLLGKINTSQALCWR